MQDWVYRSKMRCNGGTGYRSGGVWYMNDVIQDCDTGLMCDTGVCVWMMLKQCVIQMFCVIQEWCDAGLMWSAGLWYRSNVWYRCGVRTMWFLIQVWYVIQDHATGVMCCTDVKVPGNMWYRYTDTGGKRGRVIQGDVWYKSDAWYMMIWCRSAVKYTSDMWYSSGVIHVNMWYRSDIKGFRPEWYISTIRHCRDIPSGQKPLICDTEAFCDIEVMCDVRWPMIQEWFTTLSPWEQQPRSTRSTRTEACAECFSSSEPFTLQRAPWDLAPSCSGPALCATRPQIFVLISWNTVRSWTQWLGGILWGTCRQWLNNCPRRYMEEGLFVYV